MYLVIIISMYVAALVMLRRIEKLEDAVRSLRAELDRVEVEHRHTRDLRPAEVEYMRDAEARAERQREINAAEGWHDWNPRTLVCRQCGMRLEDAHTASGWTECGAQKKED